MNTTATVWLGSTLECAQCHNHKYDPFTQEDFYRFFALLNNDRPDIEADAFNVRAANLGLHVEAPTPAQAAERQRLQNEIARNTEILEKQTPALEKAQKEWNEAERIARITGARMWDLAHKGQLDAIFLNVRRGGSRTECWIDANR